MDTQKIVDNILGKERTKKQPVRRKLKQTTEMPTGFFIKVTKENYEKLHRDVIIDADFPTDFIGTLFHVYEGWAELEELNLEQKYKKDILTPLEAKQSGIKIGIYSALPGQGFKAYTWTKFLK